MGTSIGNKNRKMYSDPEYKRKIAEAKTLGRVSVKKKCEKCVEEFEVIRVISKDGIERIPKRETRFCSRVCANGHVVSNKTREKIRIGLKGKSSWYKDGRCEKEKICLNCGKIYVGRSKSTCSAECSHKYRHRNLDKTTRSYYRMQCEFNFGIKDFPNEFNFLLIEEYGWYKAKNHGDNLNGVSRDHILSVDYGYKNKIDPKIMSHPANCRLMRHNDNVSKGIKSNITYEELLERIRIWDMKYQ